MRPSELLRAGLLQGSSILIAGARARTGAASSLSGAIEAGCAALGARVCRCDLNVAQGADPDATDAEVATALAPSGRAELLVVDAASIFSSAHDDARAALGSCVAGAWSVTRAVVNAVFLGEQRGGRVVYLAPAPGAGAHAGAARAALENLARTLSIEWARHGITTVAIAPGDDTPPDDVAALVAYLTSPAGAYFSGCVLDLCGAAASA